MNTETFFPPSPDVQHLPTLFRRIQQGEIRVPAFQRGFVWREAQIVELLESVYKGFPIGSLLFWSVKEPLLKIEKSAAFPFPDVAEKYPLKFLLDGLQRLSTLYGVFHWPDKNLPGHYNVLFDLDAQEFRHYEHGEEIVRAIHLSSLFSPKEFLNSQRTLSTEPDADLLMERAIRLHSVFQEYMIPTVTIEDRAVSDVVAMFERINSTGTKLNAVDFMRAVTWSQNFDLNTEIDGLSESLKEIGFEIDDETLVKALSVVAGTDPTAESMLELRTRSAEDLRATMKLLGSLLEAARTFLFERFAMRSYEYLPYEGQLLVLIKFIQMGGLHLPDQTKRVEEWLWVTSFNEELRGKPDHYVVRALHRVERLIAGDSTALPTRLTISADDLLERRFIKGKAISAAFACMFARHEARSLVTGEVIPSQLYMNEFASKNFDGLLELPCLIEALGREFSSKKLFANTFLFSEDDILASKPGKNEELIFRCIESHGAHAQVILRSQFVSPRALQYLERRDYEGFLRERANLLLFEAEHITEYGNLPGESQIELHL